MTRHNIEVRQLGTYGGAFFNVNDRMDGCLEVSGACYSNPTYFCRSNTIIYHLLTFENQAFADEYFEKNGHYFKEIMKIEPINT